MSFGLPSRLNVLKQQLSNLSLTARLVWMSTPRWTLAWISLLVIQGLLPVASVRLTKIVVDRLVAGFGAGLSWERVGPVVIAVGLAAGVMLLTEVLQSLNEWIRATQSELIQDHIKALIHERSASVDLAFYEIPEFHDRLERARSEAGTRPLALLENFGSLLQNAITLLAMAAVLMPYGLWVPVLLLLSTLPALVVVLRFDRRYHHWWQQTTSDRRKLQYYDMMLTNGHPAAEMRLFGLGPYFRSAYQTLRHRLRTERLAQLRKQGQATVGAGVVALIVAGLGLVWMVRRALLGLVTLGDLALFYQAFTRGQGIMRSLLGSLGHIYNNTLFLGNLFGFLDLKPTIVGPPQPEMAPASLERGIVFRDVTFRYAGATRDALKDFNLTVPANRVVAIVGPNGAGKTTLLKLLCRFYDPSAGRIEIDGIDIRDFAVEDVRRLSTVLFQIPVVYHETARQSIAVGDVLASPTEAEIVTAARMSGAHDFIERFPDGYNTRLGKWFANGVELSGGEWQRIAMARAYIRRSPIIILDEPTSFMDSWAEADWFEKFRQLASGRTAIIITHRFTIAMRADVIHVMNDGTIVESGTHQELLAQAGSYATSWTAQMQAALAPRNGAGIAASGAVFENGRMNV